MRLVNRVDKVDTAIHQRMQDAELDIISRSVTESIICGMESIVSATPYPFLEEPNPTISIFNCRDDFEAKVDYTFFIKILEKQFGPRRKWNSANAPTNRYLVDTLDSVTINLFGPKLIKSSLHKEIPLYQIENKTIKLVVNFYRMNIDGFGPCFERLEELNG